MKKKNIIIAILVVITLTACIVCAIAGGKQAKSERHLNTVISSFLARDYVWDISKEKLSYPEYIEVSYSDTLEGFFIMFPLYSDGYRMYYTTSVAEPVDLFVETPYSIKSQHAEFSDIFSICKRLQYETCFLDIAGEKVLIKTVRIYRDGSVEAEDVSGTWHKKITCNNFILA